VPAVPPTRFMHLKGAWDTHTHVIGAGPDFPLLPNRSYTPPPASPEDLIAMLDRAGSSKAVVVQVSVHGSDHSRLVQALRAFPTRLRGVAAITPSTTDEELETLDRVGVVGTRVLDGLGGGVGFQSLESIAERCVSRGWHIQVASRAAAIAANTDRLLNLAVPFVIDHMGWFSPDKGLNDPNFQKIVYLLRNARCHIKLSGAFRMSQQGYPHADVIPFAQKLIETAPDRCLWGSDWPHVGLQSDVPMPQVGLLLDSLVSYTSDASLLHAILVDNPTRLYGNDRSVEGQVQ
jgi:2-pyrone-4,6-dicarboxylate lactonase